MYTSAGLDSRCYSRSLVMTLVLFGCDGGALREQRTDSAVSDDAEPSSNACSVNSDCANSQAAIDASELKCLDHEVFCQERRCHARCGSICIVARSTENPCETGICVPTGQETPGARSYCSVLPVSCSSPKTCPAYRPLDDAGTQHEWSCEDGVCVYPGFSFLTH